jgi:D-amino-acid dehydrogenase
MYPNKEMTGLPASITVVGGGVIGLAAAFALVREGCRVTVIDPEPNGHKASTGNAGGIAVTEVVPPSMPNLIWQVPRWLLDPLGPLSIRPEYAPRLLPWLVRFLQAGKRSRAITIASALAAINRRSRSDTGRMYAAIGLEGDLHDEGALAVYETMDGFKRDKQEWDLRREFGITCEPIGAEEARRMEPALGQKTACAVWMPQWSHVSDPRRIHQRLLSYVEESGGRIVKGEVRHIVRDGADYIAIHGNEERTRSAAIVIAAGAWSASLCSEIGDRVSLETERGYNMTIRNPNVVVNREIIFAERKFVATPLAIGLRVGGAAEFAGLNAPANYARSRALAKQAKLYLPDLNIDQGSEWMGHRPATPDGLPVIGPSKQLPDVYYAFGHGHLGLTQAATTGVLIADLVARRRSSIDITPYSIDRFQ